MAPGLREVAEYMECLAFGADAQRVSEDSLPDHLAAAGPAGSCLTQGPFPCLHETTAASLSQGLWPPLSLCLQLPPHVLGNGTAWSFPREPMGTCPYQGHFSKDLSKTRCSPVAGSLGPHWGTMDCMPPEGQAPALPLLPSILLFLALFLFLFLLFALLLSPTPLRPASIHHEQ